MNPPKTLSLQALAGLKDSVYVYEAVRGLLARLNDAISYVTFSHGRVQPSDAAVDGDVGLLVQRNAAGVLSLQQVTVGAVDSGGVGFRLLRVPN